MSSYYCKKNKMMNWVFKKTKSEAKKSNPNVIEKYPVEFIEENNWITSIKSEAFEKPKILLLN